MKQNLITFVLAAGALALSPLNAHAASGDIFTSVNRTGDSGLGGGAIYQFTPDGVPSVFAAGLTQPRGVGLDSSGNLFVATAFCDGSKCQASRPTVLKIAPDGTQTIFAALPANFVAEGLAVDGADNVFVVAFEPFKQSIVYRFTPDGAGGPFGFLSHHPGTESFALACDGAGNLFAADAIAQTVYEFAPDGTRTVFAGPDAFGTRGGPIGLAIDRFGNLFVSLFNGVDFAGILEFASSGLESTFATGLDNPRGLAFDSGGNLYVGEIPFFSSGDILKFTPSGVRTVFASGIGDPRGNSGPEFLVVQQ